MTLSIIIVLERHWDIEPQKVLTEALPYFKSLGYDTLCFEVPCDLSEQQIFERSEATVQYGKTIISRVNQRINLLGLDKDPLNSSYRELQELIYDYIPTMNYEDIAYLILNQLSNEQNIFTLKTAINNEIKICGIDLPAEQLDSITTLTLDEMTAALEKVADLRERVHYENLLKLQNEGKGVIFNVGQGHYKNLVVNLSKNPGLEKIVFLHPYSNKVIDASDVTDYMLPKLDEDIIVPNLLEQSIETDADREQFLNVIKSLIHNKVKIKNDSSIRATNIAPTSNSSTDSSIDSDGSSPRYLDYYLSTASNYIGQGIRNLFGFFQAGPANVQHQEGASNSKVAESNSTNYFK